MPVLTLAGPSWTPWRHPTSPPTRWSLCRGPAPTADRAPHCARLDCIPSMPCLCPCRYAPSWRLPSACLVPVFASCKHRRPSTLDARRTCFQSGLIQVSSGIAAEFMGLCLCVALLLLMPTTWTHRNGLFNPEVTSLQFPDSRNLQIWEIWRGKCQVYQYPHLDPFL